MILLDSNVPMYLVGADHPHKIDAQRVLADLIVRGERLVTDVEVFQEMMHRYVAIQRPEAIQPAFDVVLDLADEVLSIGIDEVQEAKRVVLGRFDVSARNAIHVAVMRAHEISTIVSFDAGFDRIPGIERLS